MSSFEGFQVFNFDEGVPSASVTKNGITFNRAVVMKLGFPKHVVLLINAEEAKIALKCCTEETPNHASFYKENAKGILSVRWNAKDLLNTLQSITGWNLDQNSYRVYGTLLKDEEAMLFDLTTAKSL